MYKHIISLTSAAAAILFKSMSRTVHADFAAKTINYISKQPRLALTGEQTFLHLSQTVKRIRDREAPV